MPLAGIAKYDIAFYMNKYTFLLDKYNIEIIIEPFRVTKRFIVAKVNLNLKSLNKTLNKFDINYDLLFRNIHIPIEEQDKWDYICEKKCKQISEDIDSLYENFIKEIDTNKYFSEFLKDYLD